MDPKETAVVLIEFQNEFAHPTGKNYDGVKDVLISNQTIPHAQDLMARARAKGCTIMHVPIAYAPGYPELPEDAFGIGCVVKQTGTFVKGTFGAEIIDEMQPQPGDIIIEGKRGLDAFASTNLDFILRQRGIKYVAIAGFLTNVCVESTMRSAYEKGFRVYTMTDCTAALSREIQDFTVNVNFPIYSCPMTHEEFLAQLGA
jgi:nicotinamidase-related amidase